MNILHMKMKIDSITALVAAFGGTAKLAELLDVGMSAVSNWKTADQVPPGWHLRLFIEANKRGFEIEPEFFGQPADLRPKHKGRRRPLARRRAEPRAAA
jgi:hypothetical protein